MGESFLGPPAGSLLFAAAAALPSGLDAASFAGSAALVATLGALAGGFVAHAAGLRAPMSWRGFSAACPCSPPCRCC